MICLGKYSHLIFLFLYSCLLSYIKLCLSIGCSFLFVQVSPMQIKSIFNNIDHGHCKKFLSIVISK